ncbi:carotenoid biosynthesis protein [Maribacter sp. 2307UL18-2]|uniref:carotenoid biosynthesis protein n=1 Tax=Maribacter sp. 2307UL18-2 TaxID=3386274 RepID=UPI0039BD2420
MTPTIQLTNKPAIAIYAIWLFHISGILGITLGYFDWFIEKTSVNLLACLILFFVFYPVRRPKQIATFLVFFLGGLFAEWLGVHYGILFGDYSYGSNLGLKIDGVPLLIGTYWGLLTFVTAGILDFTKWNNGFKIGIGAALMVILDFFMEKNAPIFDFWTFEGNGAPIQNYMTWYFIALLFHGILRIVKIEGNRVFALHIYLAQLLFFVFFYFKY